MSRFPLADAPQPWLEDALELLDLRPQDRCLLLSCHSAPPIAAISHAVGPRTRLVVVEPDPESAAAAARADHPNLEVTDHQPKGGESFGSFDAVFACPIHLERWPFPVLASLLAPNLRPGGRFVVDLPADNFCDPLSRSWRRGRGPSEVLDPITGPTESELAAVMRNQGLREVEASIGTHLATLDNAYSLGAFLPGLAAHPDARAEFEIELVSEFRTTGQVDVIFHRSRVHGRR